MSCRQASILASIALASRSMESLSASAPAGPTVDVRPTMIPRLSSSKRTANLHTIILPEDEVSSNASVSRTSCPCGPSHRTPRHGLSPATPGDNPPHRRPRWKQACGAHSGPVRPACSKWAAYHRISLGRCSANCLPTRQLSFPDLGRRREGTCDHWQSASAPSARRHEMPTSFSEWSREG